MSPSGIWDAFNDPNLDGWHQLWVHVRLSLEAHGLEVTQVEIPDFHSGIISEI